MTKRRAGRQYTVTWYQGSLACFRFRTGAISSVPPTDQSSSAAAFRNINTMSSNTQLCLILTKRMTCTASNNLLITYRYRGTTFHLRFCPLADRRYRLKSTRHASVCSPFREIRFLVVLQNWIVWFYFKSLFWLYSISDSKFHTVAIMISLSLFNTLDYFTRVPM